jgi:hypothetical protein
VNDALARERLSGILELIDRWGELYLRRWGKRGYPESPGLTAELDKGIDEVRARTKLAHDVIAAMGEEELAARSAEHEEGLYGSHPFTQARIAIVEAIAILAQREELAEITGPAGPRLVASDMHPVIWGSAARLWDDGHIRPAVQTAATALEGLCRASPDPAYPVRTLPLCSPPAIPHRDRRASGSANSTQHRRRGDRRMRVPLR